MSESTRNVIGVQREKVPPKVNGSKGILIVARGNLSEEDPTFLWMVQTVLHVLAQVHWAILYTNPLAPTVRSLDYQHQHQPGTSQNCGASGCRVGPCNLGFNKPPTPTPGDSEGHSALNKPAGGAADTVGSHRLASPPK